MRCENATYMYGLFLKILNLFRQVDAVLTRMTMLKERIEATECCIALDLDHRRNELVAYNLARTGSLIRV